MPPVLRSLRTIVTLYLLAALPVQGVAAMLMLHCVATDGQVTHHAGIAGVRHAHVGTDTDHAHSLAADAPDSYSDESIAPLSEDGSKCSSCASCCAGMPIVSSAVVVSPPAPAGALIAHPSVRYSDHTPERLERPPHTLLV